MVVVPCSEYGNRVKKLDSINLYGDKDQWVWIGGKDSDFSVGVVKRFLRSERDCSNNFVLKWSKQVPKKCSILVWCAEMGRIPTVDVLLKRNCYNGEDMCVLCEDS
ncbi:putative reverse transcriptase zinc-binding domain-containing protein [Helianthus annuus]|uniref:Reverse transcriptase zinc-binding domain-containing protein n=1 Tax=Helianthus annuus TaxID=4232 RepID=A0A9K3IA30_HELAN|nr:putative reverse transcriptase zinc-binding domain-containing protein [Helianthus annuus]KAJ0895356.1 putative reverse transcriptase zinc-binding domain-containing protein [Helianthus annuus]